VLYTHRAPSNLQHIGKYDIISELGRGGMGVVYRAHDPAINRFVAIKVISQDLARSPEFLQRFYQEAQAAGALQHPNIVTIYDMGESNGLAYIVMEYLEGYTLERITSRAMSVRLVHKLRYMVEACRGLQFAHRHGVIHRDIKPSNVFVTTSGAVKILDFGIARLNDPASSKTATGVMVGTLGYLSPEQLRGEPASAATDIWAVGVTSYELFSGQQPFRADSFASLVQRILSEEPVPLKDLVPTCPADLEKLVTRMLRKNTAERFQSMDELLPDLERVLKFLSDLYVRELLTQSEESLEKDDPAKAVEALREALQIDTANSAARALFDKARASLREQSASVRIHGILENAGAFIQQGNLLEARREAQTAIQIDPGYEPARQMIRQLDHLEEQSAAISRLLKDAAAKLAGSEFAAAGDLARQVLVLEADNKEAQRLLELASLRNAPTAAGVTSLAIQSAPTGFFSDVSHSRFFEGDQVRYRKIQETLTFYRDHLNGEYQSLSNQARLTYYLWIISVALGLGALVAGTVLLFLGQFAAASISAISTTFVYFIQRVFQQREDHYRALATAKHGHLEYGNHWLLVIQSIDAMQNPAERERRQGELVDVLTRKLGSSRESPRSEGPSTVRRKKPKRGP
jgi:serine/threonine protein kinase